LAKHRIGDEPPPTAQRSQRAQTVHENSQLRRENAKLRKQVQRLNSLINQFSGSNADELLEERERQKKEKREKKTPDLPASGEACPKCDTEMGVLTIGRVSLVVCPCCKFREKK